MIFGDITTGPSSDLQVATNLARAMVTRWGMSDLIGPVTFGNDGGKLNWGEVRDEAYSETIATKIDAEVSRIISDGIKSAEKVLTEHKKALDAIAHKLIEVETLEQEEYDKIIIANGIIPKKSTKHRRPLELVYYEACNNKKKAIEREKTLKTGFGRLYLKRRI
jgi:cell division protease FtsH